MSGLKTFFLAVGLVACVPAAEVQVAGPRLVLAAPGIWLVENQPYAVYYADGFYWRYDGTGWYRSTYYDDGFVSVNVGLVPRVVITGYRPAHVRYHPARHVRVQPIDRRHHSPRPHHR